jgi:hypothetical protein
MRTVKNLRKAQPQTAITKDGNLAVFQLEPMEMQPFFLLVSPYRSHAFLARFFPIRMDFFHA